VTPQALIKKDRQSINKALKNTLGKIKAPHTLKEAIKYSVLGGGKRLRPLLVIETAKALGGNIKEALPFACAVECVHNFSLIHDDLPALDNDDKRRGKPTCHKRYNEAMAILAGDCLLNLGFELIASSRHKKAQDVLKVLSGALGEEGMIGGQVLDIEYSGKKIKPNLKRKIDTMKTASLMSASCTIGALLACAAKKDIECLRAFGKNLGSAFQIADDIEDSRGQKRILQKMRQSVKHFIEKSKKNIKALRKNKAALLYIADSVIKKAERKNNVS